MCSNLILTFIFYIPRIFNSPIQKHRSPFTWFLWISQGNIRAEKVMFRFAKYPYLLLMSVESKTFDSPWVISKDVSDAANINLNEKKWEGVFVWMHIPLTLNMILSKCWILKLQSWTAFITTTEGRLGWLPKKYPKCF